MHACSCMHPWIHTCMYAYHPWMYAHVQTCIFPWRHAHKRINTANFLLAFAHFESQPKTSFLDRQQFAAGLHHYGAVFTEQDEQVLQCVAVCCSVLQCVAVCCSVLQCVAVCCSVLQCIAECCSVLQCVAVCCSVLQCVAVCCSVLQCVAVCCSVLQSVEVCCSVLQCVAMCCRVWLAWMYAWYGNSYSLSTIQQCVAVCSSVLHHGWNATMGWLRLVGCLKIYVSLQNIGLFCRSLLQKRPIFLSILLIVATPYSPCTMQKISLYVRRISSRCLLRRPS